MSLTIALARPQDVLALAAVSRRSFAKTSALSEAMFAKVDPDAADARFGRRLLRNIDGKNKAVVSATNSEGKIIGLADWDLPKTETDEVEKKEEVPEPWLEGTNVELVEEFFGEMDRRQALVREPHYHLHILVADPDHFGLGAGSALLRWGMERAEQDGHKIFLDALVAARPVYLHLGFVDYGDSLIRVGQDKEFEAYPMVWRPSTYESPTAISP